MAYACRNFLYAQSFVRAQFLDLGALKRADVQHLYRWVPPALPEDKWELQVELSDGTSKTYTLAELKRKFKQHTITGKLFFISFDIETLLVQS